MKGRGGVRKRKRSINEVTQGLLEERGVKVDRSTVQRAIKNELKPQYRKPRKRQRLKKGFPERRATFARWLKGRYVWVNFVNSDSTWCYLE